VLFLILAKDFIINLIFSKNSKEASIHRLIMKDECMKFYRTIKTNLQMKQLNKLQMINAIHKFITKRKMRSSDVSSSRNIFFQILLYLFYKNNYKLIANTKKIKNRHSGQRCFILFTGTSVKNFDFNLIKNEKVIASGMAFLHKNFNESNTVAYFNPAPWEPRSLLHLDFISSCIYKNTHKGCDIFFDASAYPYINQITSSRINDTYFVSNKGNYTSASDIEIDLHEFNNIQEGSLSLGLGISAYLGFKEIYLLGQDFLTDPPIYGHFYDGYNEIGNSSDYQLYRERASWMIKDLQSQGCKVINVVENKMKTSVIDSITFQDLNELHKECST
jgi:hypothetical protein